MIVDGHELSFTSPKSSPSGEDFKLFFHNISAGRRKFFFGKRQAVIAQ
jgi:hypothetical protein